jgi:hypothetical protein
VGGRSGAGGSGGTGRGGASLRGADGTGRDRRVHGPDAVMTFQERGELLSLLGADAQDDARLAPRSF